MLFYALSMYYEMSKPAGSGPKFLPPIQEVMRSNFGWEYSSLGVRAASCRITHSIGWTLDVAHLDFQTYVDK